MGKVVSMPSYTNCDIFQALRLIGELCLHYSIRDGVLWSKLLQALFNLGMVSFVTFLYRCPT